MHTALEPDRWRMISRLRQRGVRHRKLAEALAPQDRLIALAEAGQSETEASKLEAELSGAIAGMMITAPFHEQI